MGKKSILVLVFLVCAVNMVACGKSEAASELVKEELQVSEELASDIQKEQTETESFTQTEEQEKSEEQEQTIEEVLQKVTIYYGNGTATGLKTEEVSMSEITPTTLIGLLARHNIVSIDTKAQNFEEKEENGKKVLYLDLSKQFKDYVNMMGRDGEYIVIAGLTNTFLETYQADALFLTVNGKALSSNFYQYEEPLSFYPMEEEVKKELTYQLTEEVIEEENVKIKYPQFTNMQNEKVMHLWNESIKEAAVSNAEETGIINYSLDYEITTQNAGMVSMILRGSCNYEGAAYPYDFKSTFNFNLSSGKNLRLKEYRNVEDLAELLQNGNGYKILGSNVTNEEFNQYMQKDSKEEYKKLLESFDYDLSNSNLIPTGYSYIKDDQTLVLVIEVNHALGDSLELEIE